jgi:hypothetical protein
MIVDIYLIVQDMWLEFARTGYIAFSKAWWDLKGQWFVRGASSCPWNLASFKMERRKLLLVVTYT